MLSIDLDLILYGDIVMKSDRLTLPHPRMFERAFVLVPLNEIIPGRVISGRSIRDALKGLDDRGIERLPPLQVLPPALASMALSLHRLSVMRKVDHA